jgi:DNA (cytosine-5)-methyltransferase 1
MMTLGTFCSGIGAPEVAGMGRPLWFSEIDPFPSAVLAHHFPETPNLGDMTAPDLLERIASIGLPDIVVAGLPCQPFSVAGLRRGVEDPRNLTVRFVELADAIDDLRRSLGKGPTWWLVENVPGLLSDKNNAFGALLGGMVGDSSSIIAPNGWANSGVVDGPERCAAWRVLDAQHFGVAQRRRRVFVLARGGAGKWRCADALLPISESVRWHPPPSREAGEEVAGVLTSRASGGGGGPGAGTDEAAAGYLQPVARSVAVRGRDGTPQIELGDDKANAILTPGGGRGGVGVGAVLAPLIAHTLRGDGFDASEDGTGRGVPLVVNARETPITADNLSLPLGAQDHGHAVLNDVHPTLSASTGGGPTSQDWQAHAAVINEQAVRRLMPVECEFLQGFPRGYTAITYRGKPAADGNRYKALGNSMAVPVVRWIGERIDKVDSLDLIAEAAE